MDYEWDSKEKSDELVGAGQYTGRTPVPVSGSPVKSQDASGEELLRHAHEEIRNRAHQTHGHTQS